MKRGHSLKVTKVTKEWGKWDIRDGVGEEGGDEEQGARGKGKKGRGLGKPRPGG